MENLVQADRSCNNDKRDLVVNRELGADFAVEEFQHVAVWYAAHEWIEMRLRAKREQHVTISDLGMTVSFAAGEEIRTEISAKFRRDNIEAELAAARLRTLRLWTDPDGDYGLTLAQAALVPSADRTT